MKRPRTNRSATSRRCRPTVARCGPRRGSLESRSHGRLVDRAVATTMLAGAITRIKTVIPTKVATGLCGVVSLVRAPIDPSLLDHLRASWQLDPRQVWSEGPVVLCAASGGLFPADPHQADAAVLI